MPSLYYNRACFYAHIGETKQSARDLSQAITLLPVLKDYAKEDEDLRKIYMELFK